MKSFVKYMVAVGLGWMTLEQNAGAQGPTWTNTEIGAPSVAGSLAYDAGTDTYTVQGSGTGVNGTADSFHYASQILTGDGELVARIVTQSDTGSSARAGIMIREGVTPGSRNAFLHTTISDGLSLQLRNTTDGASAVTSVSGAAPKWLRLVREGTLISGYQSADGVSWTLVEAVNLPLPQAISIGLAVTSGDDAVLGTATFDQVQLHKVEGPAGLSGTYFHGSNLTTLRVVRRDGSINFEWEGLAPDAGVEAGDFSVRWKGEVLPAFSENYTFYTLTDDKVRLWVNDQLLIDNWTSHAATEDSATLPLAQGVYYRIKMEYARTSGTGLAILSWSSPSLAKEIIPYLRLRNLDLDGDGIPDAWENSFGLNPYSAADASADPDGDGASNLQEYLNGSNPNDYYNGVAPALEIASGNNQSGLIDAVFAQPLKVRVKKNGVAMSNAPVTFEISGGGGALTNSSGGGPVQASTVRTDSQGYASVYFKGASLPGETALRATVSVGTQELVFSMRTVRVGQTPLPIDGMVVWLKATGGITKDVNGKVSSWTDFSGTGHHATQTTAADQPLLVENALNGKPALRFDGTSNNLKIVSALTDFTAGMTAFVLAKPTNPRNFERFFDFGMGAGNNNLLLCRWYAGNQVCFQTFNGGSATTNLQSPAVIVQNQYQLLTAAQNGTNAYIYKDGDLTIQAAAVSIPNANRTSNYIGKSNWGDPTFQGEMAEIIIYNRLLSDSERKGVEAYLNQKYLLFAAPATIQNLQAAAASGSQVDLTWSPVTGADEITIERKPAGGTEFAIVAKAAGASSAYCDQGLSLGTGYTYRVTASRMGVASAASNEASATTDASGLVVLPAANLTVWLKANVGAAKDVNGKVNLWGDFSGTGHDATQATAASQPLFVDNVLNGKPVLRFDGTSNYLSIVSALTDFTGGCSAFVIVKPTNLGNYQRFFDFGNGPNSDNIMFYRMGTGDTLEYVSMSAGTVGANLLAPGAIVQNQFQAFTAVQDSANAVAYKNGLQVAAGPALAIRNIARTSNFIGKSNWTSDALFQGDIAEVIVYNRQLSNAERQAVEKYLNAKYALVAAPAAITDLQAVAASGSQIDLTWTASPTAAEVRVERKAAGGTEFAEIARVEGTVSAYCDQNLAVGTSYTYRVVPARMGAEALPSNEVTATTDSAGVVYVPTDKLAVWLKAGAGVVADVNNKVSLWRNFAPIGNSAVQASATLQPLRVNSVLNGRPVVEFDGANDYLSVGLTGLSGNKLSIFVVTKGANYQSLVRMQQSGFIVYPWSTGQTFITSSDGGTGSGVASGLVVNQWNIGSAIYEGGKRMATYRNGLLVSQRAANTANLPSEPLRIGSYNGSAEFLQGQVAEILIYHRALSDAERTAVETYLNQKYEIVTAPATATNVTATPISVGQIDLKWSPAAGVTGYRIERKAAGESAFTTVTTVASGVTTYMDRNLSPSTSYTYRVVSLALDEESAPTTESSTTTLSEGTAMPLDALAVWLRSDSGVSTDTNGKVAIWYDQSGNGNHASQGSAGNRPIPTASALNGLPVINFNGSSSFDLPNFATGMTAGEMFVIHRSALNQAASGYLGWHRLGNAPSGHYPHTGIIYDDFGSTVRKTTGVPVFPIDQYHLYNAVSRAGEWTSRINGRLHFTTNVNAVGFPTNPALGYDGYYFAGDTAEILIFNRALTTPERQSVELYLNGKYAIVADPAVTPTEVAGRSISASQISLVWTLPGTATLDYAVERKTGENGTWSVVANPPGTARGYLDSGLDPNTAYSYRVKSRTFSGWSAASTPVTVTTAATGTALPFNQLVLWLDPEFGVSSDENGKIVKWSDGSGRGNDGAQATAGSRPELVTNALNSHPVVRFDGTNSFLQLGNNFSDFTAGVSAYVVVKPTAVAADQRYFDLGGGQALDNILLGRSGTTANLVFNAYNGGGAGSYSATGAITQDQFQVFEVNMLSSGGTILKNGSPLATGGLLGLRNIARTSNFLGKSNWSGTALFQGDMAEVLIFNAGLSDDDRYQVESYLMRKYALLAVPAVPTAFSSSIALNGQVRLTWKNPDSDSRTRVVIERRIGQGAWEQIARLNGATEYLDTAAQPGVLYSYRIRAENPGGYSAYTSEAALATPTLLKVAGDYQTGVPGAFTRLPLQVAVADSVTGTRIGGFPVTFTVSSGGGLLSTTPNGNGPFVTSVTVPSNFGQGVASVYFLQSAASGATSVVTAEAGVAGTQVFTTWTHDLLGFWRFNEAGGTTISDASDYGHMGALAGGATRVNSFGAANQQWDWQLPGATALQLNGTDAAAEVPYDAALLFGSEPFSVAAWIKPDPGIVLASELNVYPIVAQEGGAGAGFSFSLKGGARNGLSLEILAGGTVVQEIHPRQDLRTLLLDGFPHLVAFSRDYQGKGTLYVDGVDVSTPGTGLHPDVSQALTSVESLWIGRDSSGHFFRGMLEDIRLMASALVADDLKVLVDRDGDALPDWWEVRFFGGLAKVATEDSDGDGVTNAQELVEGSDPTNAASNEAPLIRKTAGDGQSGTANTFLAQPLEVTVTNSYGGPIANAEVIFSVETGGGQLATAFGSSTLHVVETVLTDAFGKAQVFFRQPANGSVTSTVSARTGLTPPVTFTIQSGALVSYLKLNENTGLVAADASGAGNPGAIASDGSITWGVGFDGLPGLNVNGAIYTSQEGLAIDNTGNRVIAATGGAFSISLWFRAGTLAANEAYALISNAIPDASGFQLAVDAGLLQAGTPRLVLWSDETGGSLHLQTSTEIVTGRWYHVVISYDGTTAKIYLDGTLAATGNGTIVGNTAPLRLATGIAGLNLLAGGLDEIKIFSKTLEDGEAFVLANDFGNPADADGNGIPDGWEYRYFGANGIDPNGDPDGDGVSNLQEWRQRSNPLRSGVTDTAGALELQVFTDLE